MSPAIPGVAPGHLANHVARVAREAGRAIMDLYEDPGPAGHKAGGSPVTEADHRAHAVIHRRLTAIDPGIPILSEEGVIPAPAEREQWSRWWLVDPLDGTKEFLRQNGEFTVNIALMAEGIPVLGVVHAPALGRTYVGGREIGSWRIDGDGPARRISSGPAAVGAAVRVVESRSHPSPAVERYLAHLQVSTRVSAGSSLKFCLVAEGDADLYPRFGPTMEWDTAAGDAVFRYSGLGEPRWSPLRYDRPDLKHPPFVLGAERPAPGGLVVWMTGLSGAGKSTIAAEVVRRLEAGGTRVEYLDGDVIRDALPATGFTRAERDAHVRRVGYLASRLEYHGVTVVCALVSPYRSSRRFVRGLCRRFIEVHVATSLEECERRDVKGLYAKARVGEIANLTGVGDPYEMPIAPEVRLSTEGLSVDESTDLLFDGLRQAGATGGPIGP